MTGLPVLSAGPDDPAFFQDPYPVYARMRQAGPAFVWKEYGFTAFPRFAEVNAILRDRRFGREITHVMSREEAGLPPIAEHVKPFYDFEANSLLEREPPAHTRLRALVNRAFVSRHVERLRPRVAALAHELIDGFEGRGEIDLLPAFAEKIPVIVIAELLGVPVDMAPQLLDWSHKMVAMYQFNRSRETEDAAVRATAEFSAFMRAYAEARRGDPRDDLLTKLIEAEEAGERLSADELVTTAILLLNAGHEATVHGIGNGVKALLENGADPLPHLAGPDGGAGAADELLRFDSPLHVFTRYVLEDCEVSGVDLRKGQTVALLLGSANRDPARFAVPDSLDFQRGGSGHASFGAGIHFCVGAPLARIEMAEAIRVLFERLPSLELAAKPSYADRYHFHGLAALRIRW